MEPILKTPNPAGQGAPVIADEQYKIWLDELRPNLELSCSLYRACVKAGLEGKYDSILEKYKLNDWFSKKVDAYRTLPGENANEAFTRLIQQINIKIKREELLTREEIDILKHFTDKHRTAQPFFVSRTETSVADPNQVGKILDTIESTNYEQLGPEIKEQIVAPNAPIQDKGQDGATGDVSAKQPTA